MVRVVLEQKVEVSVVAAIALPVTRSAQAAGDIRVCPYPAHSQPMPYLSVVAGSATAAPGRLQIIVALVLLNEFISASRGLDAKVVPHIRDCSFCRKCDADGNSADEAPAEAAARRLTMHHAAEGSDSHSRQLLKGAEKPPKPPKPPSPVDPYEDPSQPFAMRASAYLIRYHDKVPKSSLPNCSRCRGCNTELSLMASTSVMFDRTFTNEKGATSGWLFRATTNRTASGAAVVKVYCMPLPKRVGARTPQCAPQAILKNMRLLLAIEKITEECGFEDIVPKLWVDKVNAPVPGIGFHIRWHGLWMEVAQGVSMENFLNKGEPSRFPPSVILDVMHNKLNKTQVIRGAIFDLLTSQCDRHAQNIFINEQGQIKLIDNEAALQSAWKNCGFNSILVPTTQKQEIVRLSNEFVNKLVTVENAPKGHADPQLLLDYRCYLPGGKEEIGTEYPPQIRRCLAAIANKTVQQVQEHYGFLEELPAYNLKARATDMLNKGFEHAFKYGDPQNAKPKKYRLQPKCCKIKYENQKYVCAHPWQPKHELPVGDPITGRDWIKPRPDTGTYEGGTFS